MSRDRARVEAAEEGRKAASGVQSPRHAVETASLATARLVVKVLREMEPDTRADSQHAADTLIEVAREIEERMDVWAVELGANYARQCTVAKLATPPQDSGEEA